MDRANGWNRALELNWPIDRQQKVTLLITTLTDPQADMDQVVKHESVAECHTDADGKTVQTKSNYLETEGSFAKSNEYKSDDGKEVSSKSKEVQSSAARLEQSK